MESPNAGSPSLPSAGNPAPVVGGAAAAGSSLPGSGTKIDIARLLEAVLKYNASDLHIRVGRPPAVRVRGELHDLGATPLTADDTVGLMKSIASERHQQELGEK